MSLKTNSRRNELLGVLFCSFSFIVVLSGQVLLGLALFLASVYVVRRVVGSDKPGTGESPSIAYAGFWRRLGAGITDMGLNSTLFFAAKLIIGMRVFDMLTMALFTLIWALACFYFLKRWGQTPGKMLMGVQVVGIEQPELTTKQALLRMSPDLVYGSADLLKVILVLSGILTIGLHFSGTQPPDTYLVPLPEVLFHYLLGFYSFWMFTECIVLLFNRKKRALHDLLAQTVVVVQKPVSALSLLLLVVAVIPFYKQAEMLLSDKTVEYCALKGNPSYQSSMGYRYYKGGIFKKVIKDHGLARYWFEKAAAQGEKNSQFYLGEIYERGLEVKADPVKAAEWYGYAAKNGSHEARKALERMRITGSGK